MATREIIFSFSSIGPVLGTLLQKLGLALGVSIVFGAPMYELLYPNIGTTRIDIIRPGVVGFYLRDVVH